ncbi:(2Fe-2S)-binding protein, partial [Nonomuraea basaltis]|uniref:(2Fe-2S)-binding protein n=1 Tax=Nonomuraea basaltis TaxID=2495887 RepID=UPI0014867301
PTGPRAAASRPAPADTWHAEPGEARAGARGPAPGAVASAGGAATAGGPPVGGAVGVAEPGGVEVAAGEVAGVLARRRERWRAFGEALQRAYPVKSGWQGWLRDDTLVCRCEEVPLARVREAQELGATDARSIKLLARPGMGWCQGRMCGYAVSCLAGEPPQPPRRPIAQPVTLGALSDADTEAH